MSVFTPKKTIIESKVHNSQYIKTDNNAKEDGITPIDPVVTEPEAK